MRQDCPGRRAALALIHFEREWRHLGAADRAYFAEELAGLAREAEVTR